MSIKNLESIHDLVQKGEVNNMESQTGPAFPIVGPNVERGLYPFGVPNGSQLHGGPAVNQAGRSLVGPNYQGAYGGISSPSVLDNNGETPDDYSRGGPDSYVDNLPD